MKFFLLVSLVGLSALANAADYPPRFAYLVVPPGSQQETNSTTTTPSPSTTPKQDEKENLESINDQIMERLRQEFGSEQGVYHVYLSDGRLQRVQYTTAPVNNQNADQSQAAKSENLEAAGPEQSPRQGIYYVQVPEERLQTLRANPSPVSQNDSQSVQGESFAQYRENAAANVKAEFVPFKFITADQMSQIRSSVASEEKTSSFGQEEGSAASGTSRQEADGRSASQRDQSAGIVASVQYSDVQPISGPVFSYSPKDLVRILRYAQH